MKSKTIDSISGFVDRLFDDMTVGFLGFNPSTKRLTSRSKSLVTLFMAGLGKQTLNDTEKEILKNTLQITYSYIDSIRSHTKARVLDKVSAYVKDAEKSGDQVLITRVREIVGGELAHAGQRMRLAVNTEANKIRNLSTAMKIERMANQRGIEDPNVFWVVTLDEATAERPEKTLHLIPGTSIPRVWKLSEFTSSYWRKGMEVPSIYGGHPHCFLGNSGINVFTEKDGYKNIKDVKIGERVLTHTGKFKRVLNTLEWYSKKYYGEYYRISFTTVGRDGKKKQTVKVTPEHKFKTDKGWVEAKNLTKHHKLTEVMVDCASCGLPVQPKPKRIDKRQTKNLPGYFCSHECSSRYQWKCEDHKENISKKSSKQMKEMWKKPTEELIRRLRKAQNKTREMISEGEFWAQKPENKERLVYNAAKVNSKFIKGNPSREEAQVFRLVKSIYPNAQSNEIVSKFCVDILLEDKKVIIEYDGGGHYLPVYCGKFTMESFLKRQEGRDRYLNKFGYHVLRYNSIPTREQLVDDIIRVSSNSSGSYSFRNIEIEEIRYFKNGKNGFKLYDLKVEDDESFVVNGIVSHNCRCILTFLAPGWSFNSKGKIKYVGKGHDEYEHQRKKWPLKKP